MRGKHKQLTAKRQGLSGQTCGCGTDRGSADNNGMTQKARSSDVLIRRLREGKSPSFRSAPQKRGSTRLWKTQVKPSPLFVPKEMPSLQPEELRKLLKSVGLKVTASRLEILSLLSSAQKALLVGDIQSRLESRGTKASPSTVYRVLSQFVKAGLLRLYAPLGEEIRYYFYPPSQAEHLAVCSSCYRVIELPSCPLLPVVQQLEEGGFQVHSHRVEIYGLCASCKNA